jgi:hypothetical protein
VDERSTKRVLRVFLASVTNWKVRRKQVQWKQVSRRFKIDG